MRRAALVVLLVFILLPPAAAVLLTSCAWQKVYSCEDPCLDCIDFCCIAGRCVPTPPSGWEGPLLLWTGSADYENVVLCPYTAPDRVFEGYAGFTTGSTCPTCECDPAPCQLGGATVSVSAVCQPGAPEVPIPLPDGWGGECATVPQIPAAEVGTVHFLEPTVGPCEPVAGPVPLKEDPFEFSLMGIACAGTPAPNGCLPGQVCAPLEDLDLAGYRICLLKRGEVAECPVEFPEQQIFAQGFDPSTAGCSECACGAPQGATCAAEVVAYEQAGCVGGLLTNGVSLGIDACAANQLGIPVTSLGASWTANQPGSCEPIPSVPSGEPTLIDPSTFCCRL